MVDVGRGKTKKKKDPQKYYVGEQEVSKEEYLAARGKLGFETPRTGAPSLLERGTTPRVEEAITEGFPTPETRKREFEEVTGGGALREELREKIAEMPSMAPEKGALIRPLIEPAKGILESRQFPAVGISGLGAAAKLLENPEQELKRYGVELAAGTAVGLGALSLGFLSQLVAKSTITKAVIGSKGVATALSIATTGLGIFVVGPGIFDYRGDEMETHRKIIQSVIEVGERIEAANRNNDPVTSPDTIELLRTIAEEVDFAEQRIAELGIYNFNYRYAKEYLDDMKRVRSARIAIERRVGAVVNTAVTGGAALRPEELLFDVAQFEK